jgi:perosamine synthetase
MEIADRHGLVVIEDCAESHGATVRGRMTGTFGQMGCFSFYANTLITTGEGGMVITDDDALAERLRLLRNLGFGTPRFYHEVPAFNFRMTGLQAALGLAQLPKLERFVEEKRRLAAAYHRYLGDVPGLRLPVEREWARNVYWMYGVVVEPEFGMQRDELARWLREHGVDTRTMFCPMNLQPFLRAQPGYREVQCPVAEELWRAGLYLPSSTTLDDASIRRVAEAIRAAAAAPRPA